jgi:DNA replication protein DnaC
MTHEELLGSLSELRLTHMKNEFADLARIATRDNKSYEQYLLMLTQSELRGRQDAKVKRLINEAKFPLIKELEKYDYKKVRGITARDVNRLAMADFVKEGKNIVLFGQIGVGKTHLAIGLGKVLCEKKYRCLFVGTSSLIDMLLESQKKLEMGSLWKKLDLYDVIICDELGYIPQTKEGADLFFQFISQRYERKSLLITTNLTYSEWDKVFLNETTTAAAVDRIIHRCETYNIEADSWRKREALTRKNELESKDEIVIENN